MDTDLLMRNIVLKNMVAVGSVNAGYDAFEKAIRDFDSFATRWPETLQGFVTRHPIADALTLLQGKKGGMRMS